MSDGDVPAISVTVLNYNYAHYLPQCLDSILDQSLGDFEIILINDCSTDDSRSVIEPYLTDPRIRFVDHQQNQGFVKSLIEGSDLGRGRYTTVISADDWVASRDAFRLQYERLQSSPAVGMVISSFVADNSDGSPLELTSAPATNGPMSGIDAFIMFLKAFLPIHSGLMFRSDLYRAVGGYSAGLRWALDRQILLDIALHSEQVAVIDEPLYVYRRHTANMSKRSADYRAMISELIGVHDSRLRTAARLFPERPWHQIDVMARREALGCFAADNAFSGRRREAFEAIKAAFAVDPFHTATNKAVISTLLRVSIGEEFTNKVRHRANSSAPTRR